MAVKPLEIHPAALAELQSALRWYLERSRIAAGNFVSEIDQAMTLISQSPSSWPAGEYSTRKFVLRRFPFAIVYREKMSRIELLAFAHGHRLPGLEGPTVTFDLATNVIVDPFGSCSTKLSFDLPIRARYHRNHSFAGARR